VTSELEVVQRPAPWSATDTLWGLALGLSLPLALELAGVSASPLSRTTPLLHASLLLAIAAAFYAWQIGWAWAFSLRKYRLGLSAWGFTGPLPATYWLAPLAFVLAIAVQMAHVDVTNPPPVSVPPWLTETHAGIALMFLSACVIAPVAEEIFFRGFIFTGLAGTTGWVWAAVISSALFAASHFDAYSIVPLFVAGLVLCWVRRSGGSLWGAIAVHFAMTLLVWGVRVGRQGSRVSLPNKRVNLTRPTVSVVTWSRTPRRLRAARSA
jgi:membrane protease YdiL (CAAX protease family)